MDPVLPPVGIAKGNHSCHVCSSLLHYLPKQFLLPRCVSAQTEHEICGPDGCRGDLTLTRYDRGKGREGEEREEWRGEGG